MPVKDKVESHAYCDVCGAGWARTCAICGGLFCGSHSTHIDFKPRGAPFLQREICKKCMQTATVAELIKGRHSQSWQGEEYSDDPQWIADLLLETEKPKITQGGSHGA